MDWIAQNWVWVLFAVGMIAMHMFGHGGHGGHGGHDRDRDDPKSTGKEIARPTSGSHSGRHH